MGFFRSSFFGLACLLVFSSFLAMNLFLTLDSSLKYENVQSEIPSLINELTNSPTGILSLVDFGDIDINQATDKAKVFMENYCQNNTEYVFSFDGRTISIPCSSLEKGPEAVLNETASDFVDDIYYKEYDCNFLNCFTKEKVPFFLVSQKAKDYWHQKFLYALIISLVLMAFLLLLVESRINWPILVGSLLILSALPLLKIKSLILFFIPEKLHVVSVFLGIFFTQAYGTFWISFIIGLVLIGLGLGLRFSNAEFVERIIEKIEKKEAKEKRDAGKKLMKKETVKKEIKRKGK